MLPSALWAQTGITGQVTGEDTDEPLTGATIFIVETQQGTAADVEGNFDFVNMEPGTYTLRVTFIGYQEHQQQVTVEAGQMTPVDVVLSQDHLGLDELVVTGYSIRERREVTGAISSIRTDQIRTRAIQTPDQAIQGRSAGTQMVGSSGQPGAAANIRIRGTGSINSGNEPLYIVDGIPIEDYFRSDIGTTNTNLLVSLNPADIESIDILRDAEATAIYGARGANGVVLITTSRGETGPTHFTASIRAGVHQLHKRYDLMDGPEFVTFMQEAYANRYEDLGRDPEEGRQAAIDEFGHPNEVRTYDWFGALTRPGQNTRYSLAARGGTDDTRFYISGGYEDHQGTMLSSTFDRVNLRTNIDHDATDWLSLETRLNISRSQYNGQAETGGNWINSPFHGGVTTRVTTPIYNDDGSYNQDIPGVIYNNVQLAREEERLGREFQLIGNISARVDINPNLALRGQYNADVRLSRDRRYNNPSIPRYANFGGSVYERTREIQNYSGNVVADFITSFQDVHNVSAVAGGEYHHRDYRFHAASGEEIPNPLLGQLNLAGIASAVSGRTSEYKTAGLFTRLQYNYNERYFTSVNLRYDGHSRFGLDTRWGMFYSGAIAWDAARERFLQNVGWLNQLRPRFSYGITGNDDIADFASRALFGSGGTYQGSTGLRPAQLGNARLGWEITLAPDVLADNTDQHPTTSGRYDGQAVNSQGSHITFWNTAYLTINEANYVIDGVEQTEGVAQETRDRLLGEALFQRGFAYFDLARTYGYEPGREVNGWTQSATIRTEPTRDVGDADLRPRSSNTEVYNQARQDLEQAVQLLGNGDRGVYFANYAGGHALLARLHLYLENWQEAVDHADEALTSTGAELVDNESAFENNTFAQTPNPESILELSIDPVEESLGSIVGLCPYTDPRHWHDVVPSQNLLDLFDEKDYRNHLFDEADDGWPYTKKWDCSTGPFDDNVPIVRLPEMLLIKAEAHAELGQTTEALEHLATLQEARGIEAFESNNAEEIIEEVMVERRRELNFEGHRWYDLKRRAMDIPKQQVATTVPYDDFRILSYLPQSEVDNNPELDQNPGY